MPRLDVLTPTQQFLVPGDSAGLPFDSLEALFAKNFLKLDGLLGPTQTDIAAVQAAAASPVLPATTGSPIDTPAAGTVRFDRTAAALWIYTGTAWKTTVLTDPTP